jgi:hypothetical protein
MGVLYMIDPWKEICKPVLKLDFTMHKWSRSQNLDSTVHMGTRHHPFF